MAKRFNLKAFRTLHGLTQPKMAKKCNVSIYTYNSIENGKSDGKMKFWDKLKEEFKLTGVELCDLQEKRTIQEF